MTQLQFQDLRKASTLKLHLHYSFFKLHIPTPSGKAKSIFGDSEMKERDCPGPCGSTLRNKSCSCLKTAVALSLLYSTHYYQDILTFGIKGKRGRNRETDFKGGLASMFFSLELPLFPQVSLALKQLRQPGNSHPLESQVPIMSAFCPDSLLQRQRN